MEKFFTVSLNKLNVKYLMHLVLFLSLVLFSNCSDSPQKYVIGTWTLDGMNGDHIDSQHWNKCYKILIESTGESLYKITEHYQLDNGDEKVYYHDGVFRNIMGQMFIEIQGSTHIEYLPEAKKIKFFGDLYSKQ